MHLYSIYGTIGTNKGGGNMKDGNTKDSQIIVEHVDREKKDRAKIVLATKGKTLAKAVRELIDKLSDEYDDIIH